MATPCQCSHLVAGATAVLHTVIMQRQFSRLFRCAGCVHASPGSWAAEGSLRLLCCAVLCCADRGRLGGNFPGTASEGLSDPEPWGSRCLPCSAQAQQRAALGPRTLTCLLSPVGPAALYLPVAERPTLILPRTPFFCPDPAAGPLGRGVQHGDAPQGRVPAHLLCGRHRQGLGVSPRRPAAAACRQPQPQRGWAGDGR